MVGGTVIETIEKKDTVWVNCQSTTYNQTCAIWIEKSPKSRSISEGDSLWWQSGNAYWTPHVDESQQDTKLNKIGFSHSRRPDSDSDGPTVKKERKPKGYFLWIGTCGVVEWVLGYKFGSGFYVGKCYHTGNHWLKDLFTAFKNPNGKVRPTRYI